MFPIYSVGKVCRFQSITLLIGLLLASPAGAQQILVQPSPVNFLTSCNSAAQAEFNRALVALHSFQFIEAVEGFESAQQADASCGIAYWGTAMTMLEKRWPEATRQATTTGPLGGPPPSEHVRLGTAAVERAKAVGAKTQRERDYIGAVEFLYADTDKLDYGARAKNYEKAMEVLAAKYPEDQEAAVLYALALNITIDPYDRTYPNQHKAGAILEKVFAEQPDHPGAAHYLIYTYDFPGIASKGLSAARDYAKSGPATAHAKHLPSHIFTRSGYWQESIDSNRASIAAAREELRLTMPKEGAYNALTDVLHAMDAMVYAALQLGKDHEAKAIVDEVLSIDKIETEHFAAAYAFAAIPARYALERQQWTEAAQLTLQHPKNLSWPRHAPAEVVLWFARGIGAARSGNTTSAKQDLARIEELRDEMIAAKNPYWAEQAEIQRLAVSGWIARSEQHNDDAVTLLTKAAEMEAGIRRHPISQGLMAPVREMLGALLLEVGQPTKALSQFEDSLATDPRRFNSLSGAARAASRSGDAVKARKYYADVLELAKSADSERPAVIEAKTFVAQ
jgi:hypothetical protein